MIEQKIQTLKNLFPSWEIETIELANVTYVLVKKNFLSIEQDLLSIGFKSIKSKALHGEGYGSFSNLVGGKLLSITVSSRDNASNSIVDL